MNGLSVEQLRFFRNTGYLRLSEIVNNTHLDEMTRVIDLNINNKIPPYRVNKDDEICRLDQILDRSPVFLEVLRLPEILHPLISILGPNIEIAKFRHNHSTLNRRDDIPYRLHRDIQHWTRALVTLIIYLERSTVTNGCTHIIPTSQFLPFEGPQSGDGGGNWADEHELAGSLIEQALPIPMDRGGVLLIDSLAYHSVGINSTNASRMSVTFALHSVDDLSNSEDDPNRILLIGKRIYKGTDKLKISGSLSKG